MIFIGDIHGNRPGRLPEFLEELKKKPYENDILIQVGDLGLGYHSLEWEIEMLSPYNEWLSSRNCTMYAIRGNHDDPSRFENDPFGFSNIKLMKDWSILEIQGYKVMLVGGAISIDRIHSTEGKSWWSGENFPREFPDPSYFDGVNVVCTHTCPSFTWPFEFAPIVSKFFELDVTLKQDLIDERRRVDMLFNQVWDVNNKNPIIWMYGHMHGDHCTQYENSVFQCCNICQFYEL